MANDPLKSAFAAFREETAGHSEHADATLERLLAGAEARKVRRLPRAVRWIPLAAALAASSAWAALGQEGTTRVFAQLTERPTPLPAARPSLRRMAPPAVPVESVEPAEPVVAEVPVVAAPAAAAAVEAPTVVAPTVATPVAHPVAKSRVRAGTGSPANAEANAEEAPAPAPVATPEPEPTTPTTAEVPDALAVDARDFKTAYRVHSARDASQSVRAWDTYLAAHPTGRFVPEARYARAMSLVRAGRRSDARAALQPFAAAPAGSYRQADAARVLRALE